ncbi:MAG: thioredoxin domain-containing protein [Deltaproteobacteria bacterium]|nr:thioredoxin domain-containing protein [Deltaproteobacteria bacterium]
MRKGLRYLVVVCIIAGFVGCSPSPQQLKKTLENNPDIVFNVIKKNPTDFVQTLQLALQAEKEQEQKTQLEAKAKTMEDEFSNPKQPEISPTRAIAGNPSAHVTLVEYSDFQCSYCARAHDTVKKLQKKYGNDLRLVYKHLPLDFHPNAMPAARYFEAIALQSPSKAYAFHDLVFKNQDKFSAQGVAYLETAAQQLGLDMSQLKKDLDSRQVKTNIERDIAEAKKFGFTGTPGFLVNGVSVKGAYPAEEFEKIIDRHMASIKTKK